jgi:hypothetical protein
VFWHSLWPVGLLRYSHPYVPREIHGRNQLTDLYFFFPLHSSHELRLRLLTGAMKNFVRLWPNGGTVINRILAILLLVAGSISVPALSDSSLAGFFQDPLVTSVIKAAEAKYGVHCDPSSATAKKTARGYYSDYTFLVSLPCGAPSKSTHFKSLTVQFNALHTEMEGDLHVSCISYEFAGADFGMDDPTGSCKP